MMMMSSDGAVSHNTHTRIRLMKSSRQFGSVARLCLRVIWPKFSSAPYHTYTGVLISVVCFFCRADTFMTWRTFLYLFLSLSPTHTHLGSQYPPEMFALYLTEVLFFSPSTPDIFCFESCCISVKVWTFQLKVNMNSEKVNTLGVLTEKHFVS